MKIKVVKKDSLKAEKMKLPEASSKRHAAREMVSTMSDWVSEFKARKGEETKAAIERFMTPQPQTSGS